MLMVTTKKLLEIRKENKREGNQREEKLKYTICYCLQRDMYRKKKSQAQEVGL
jgi:hypothetical protein